MDFIRSGSVCIIFTSLAEFTGLMDFIRSGSVCKISTGLAKIYNNYELYKVWWPLYDIDLPTLQELPDLCHIVA